MKRIPIAFLFCLFATTSITGGAHAECSTGGPINTCLDQEPALGMDKGDSEAYERLDSRSHASHSFEAGGNQIITIGDTKVTLGQTEDKSEPWQPFNRKFGDQDSFAREDRPREGGDPLQYKCYPDGCY